MNSRAQPAKMLGVNRAGAFAQTQAITEDLRPANAGDVDEAAECVEAQETTLELRLRFIPGNRAGAAIHESAEGTIAAPRGVGNTSAAAVAVTRARRGRRAARGAGVATRWIRRAPASSRIRRRREIVQNLLPLGPQFSIN